MRFLAIETSCDETGLALLEETSSSRVSSASAATRASGKTAPKFRVLKNLVSSQIAIHRPFGGVVPNLAKREHIKNLPILLNQLAGKTDTAKEKFFAQIDFITVTVGPGLEPALWTGITFAQQLAAQYKKPLIGANHLEGHLYSFLLSPAFSSSASAPKKNEKNIKNMFPAVALIVSGGHTILLQMESLTKWKRLGETRDDAAGEAYDKVARLLDLPYPGGPEVEKLAKKQSASKLAPQGTITFPRPMLRDKNYDFSFSGLKTAVLYYMRDHAGAKQTDIAASFQAAAIDVLAAKTVRAVKEFGAKSIILCGGVAANKALRARLKKESKKLGAQFLVPEFKYNLDNAAMIGAAGYMARARKKKNPLRADGAMEI